MTYAPRQHFGAKLEPVETVLHGAGQDIQGFRDYCAVFPPDRQPAVYMTYVGIAGDQQIVAEWGQRLQREVDSLPQKDLRLQIGLNMTGGKDTGEGRDDVIASGTRDANIAAFCDVVEQIGLPAYIRIGYEFEGHWNGYQPASYRAAFERITWLIRERQLNAATVWCSSGASAGSIPLDRLMNYYPGDEWVDWWGIDLFDGEEMLSDHTRQFCERAGDHHKPVLIGESTPRHVGVLAGDASWQRWFAPYFTLIRQQPQIKLFSYINWEWVYWSDTLGFQWHDWGDGRIEQNPVVAGRFRDEMGLALYQHAQMEA